MSRRRLDLELVDRGLFESLDDARAAIQARKVLVDGVPALKDATLVRRGADITITLSPKASRAGRKLEFALEVFGMPVEGKTCLDAGAGHGGFTEVLLERGAALVVAVDVGYGQLPVRMRSDSRVVVLERTNIKSIEAANLPGPFDVVVADLSFISIRVVMKKLVGVLSDDGDLLVLVKPQFEAPREAVPKGGVVSDPRAWTDVLQSVSESVKGQGLDSMGIEPAPVKGAKGNQEFLLWAKRGPMNSGDVRDMISNAVRKASMEPNQ